jgi:hypothetical protein
MRCPQSTSIPPDAPAARCETPSCRHAKFSHDPSVGTCRYCNCAAFAARDDDALADDVCFWLTELGERALEASA